MGEIRTGGCACGAVRFEAEGERAFLDACHCRTCRAWTGGPALSLKVERLTLSQGADALLVWKSSDWAERTSCARCGGKLWFRLSDAPAGGEHYVFAGALDRIDDLPVDLEIFADQKPAQWNHLSESSRKMTAAETQAMFDAGTP